jgi:uncharacterized SAM-binding protein YcdF (DUF218 family)
VLTQSPSTPEPADAILVFGARVGASGPSAELTARLRHAAALYFAGSAPVVICSGGRQGRMVEAEVMKGTLCGWGVPADDVVVDAAARSTRETLSGLGRVCPDARRVLAVSSAFHMRRIVAEARRQGLMLLPAPAAESPVMRRPRLRIKHQAREAAALAWYAITARRSRT